MHDGKPTAGHEIWKRMAVHRFWRLLVSDCADAYYSHPWAWDEIGFGGPAYPRALGTETGRSWGRKKEGIE